MMIYQVQLLCLVTRVGFIAACVRFDSDDIAYKSGLAFSAQRNEETKHEKHSRHAHTRDHHQHRHSVLPACDSLPHTPNLLSIGEPEP